MSSPSIWTPTLLGYGRSEMRYPPRDALCLIVCHAVANIAIGVSLFLWANLSAESVLSRWLPPWFWPAMFVMAGLLALAGLLSRPLARFAFFYAAAITATFGFLSLYAVVARGALMALPSTIFLLYIAVLKISVTRLLSEREDILQQVAESTEKGKSVLDRVTDGTTS